MFGESKEKILKKLQIILCDVVSSSCKQVSLSKNNFIDISPRRVYFISMHWTVTFSGKTKKKIERLPERVRLLLFQLAEI
jgi:hypothetical protein